MIIIRHLFWVLLLFCCHLMSHNFHWLLPNPSQKKLTRQFSLYNCRIVAFRRGPDGTAGAQWIRASVARCAQSRPDAKGLQTRLVQQWAGLLLWRWHRQLQLRRREGAQGEALWQPRPRGVKFHWAKWLPAGAATVAGSGAANNWTAQGWGDFKEPYKHSFQYKWGAYLKAIK